MIRLSNKRLRVASGIIGKTLVEKGFTLEQSLDILQLVGGVLNKVNNTKSNVINTLDKELDEIVKEGGKCQTIH